MGVDLPDDEPDEPLVFSDEMCDGMDLHRLMLLVEKVVVRQIGGAVSADLEFIGRTTRMHLSIERER